MYSQYLLLPLKHLWCQLLSSLPWSHHNLFLTAETRTPFSSPEYVLVSKLKIEEQLQWWLHLVLGHTLFPLLLHSWSIIEAFFLHFPHWCICLQVKRLKHMGHILRHHDLNNVQTLELCGDFISWLSFKCIPKYECFLIIL